jgi:branched-chain amino acid transport system substrate-binding protein
MKKPSFFIYLGVILFSVLSVSILIQCKTRIDKKEIILPVVADLTGPIALYGQWAVDGMNMAVEEINAQGGIDGKKVGLIIEDGQSNPQAGVNAFQKILATINAGVIIVATNSSTVMACSPIANDKKVVLFTPIASSPSITQAGDFIFRNRVTGYYEAHEIARLAAEKLKLQTVALVVINNEAASGYITAFEDAFESRGGMITKSVLVEPGETDYRTLVLQVKNSEPKAVFLVLTVKEAALFIKQSAEMGFKPRWLSMTTIQSEDLFKIAGNHAEGLIFVAEGGDADDPTYVQFAGKFDKSYGYKPTMNALNGYDAIQVLSKLVARHGNDAEKIRDGLYALKSYQGVGGILSFDTNGDANKPSKLFIVQKGRFVPYR